MTTSTPDSSSDIDTRRYGRILFFFAVVIGHVILWDILGGRVPIVRTWVRRSRPVRYRRWSQRFRVLAIDMGGVMIKLGQFLSSRVDVLPPEITQELKGLQDEVPPVPSAQISDVLAAELGDISRHFAYFEPTPLAAASLGQAHRATLLSPNGSGEPGPDVIVKVQRPHIETLVRTDLAALHIVARWIMRYQPIRRRADVPALMDEFAATLWEELDYRSEADNAEQFGRIYATSPKVYIPAVYREHSTDRVIVLEDVESIKITDREGMVAAGIDPAEVADDLLDAYFRQFFQEGFFHADPHPGNLFVQPRPDINWEPGRGPRPFWLIFVDFGMVGRIEPEVKGNLRKLVISVTQRDAEQLTEVYQNLGFFLPGADLERITEAQEVLLNQIWGRKLLDLAQPDPQEVQELTREFRDILFDFPFQIPQDFIYLGRAVGMISGLVSELNPDINPWYKIEQYGRLLLSSEMGQDVTREAIVEFLRPYINTPRRIQRVLDLAEKGRLRVQTANDKETLQRLEKIEKRVGRLSWSILGAAGMISATLLYLNRKQDDDRNT